MSQINIGGTLYISAKDCKLTKRPVANDPSYGFLMLQPGTPVVWLGEASENKAFHKIQYKGQIGYTLMQNLSNKPFAEFNAYGCIRCKGTGKIETNWGNSHGLIDCQLCKGTGGRMPSQAFPSYGAGDKA